ncbi:MAG: hypothetical protein K5697_11950 [Lachnospiraceae bacterium]|nr:hypothetical protein [Lachnospiraceae bacterium]
MSLIEIVKFFLSLLIALVPGLAFYSLVAMVIVRVRERTYPPKAPEFYPDRHIYYPHRTQSFLKMLYMFCLAAALCLIIPFVVTLISYRLFRGGAVVVALAALAGGIIVMRRLIKESSGSVADYMIVTSEALIVHYRSGRLEQYAWRNHSGYDNGEGGIVYIVFRAQNGTESRISMGGLSENDFLLLRKDLETIKKSGNLSGNGPQMRTGRTDTENRAVNTPHAGAGATVVTRKTAVQTQTEKAALYADPAAYSAYLKQEAAKLTAEQRRELVKIIESGYMMPAIKQCREWTGLGLKEARDMVDAWKSCLADESGIRPSAEAMPGVSSVAAAMPEARPGVQSGTAAQPEVQSFTAAMPEIQSGVQPFTAEMPGVQPVAAAMPEEGPAAAAEARREALPAYSVDAALPENTEEKKELSWTLRITDKEQGVTDKRSLERNIDQAIVDIGRKREEFLVLAPSEPVRGIRFMQVCPDTNGIYFHVEASFGEKNEQGRPKLLGRDRLMSWEARNICMAFYLGEEIPMTDWSEVK